MDFEQIVRWYFAGEKAEAFWILAAGVTSLIAVLLALFFVFVMGKPSQHGFAVGLLLLVALGLTIDFYAERRATQYESALQAVGALRS